MIVVRRIPASVRAAIAINVVALVIACLRDGFLSSHGPHDGLETRMLYAGQTVFSFFFVAVFQVLIAKRQNWARITWSVIAVLFPALTLVMPALRPPSPPIFALVYFLDLALRIAGVRCLFARSSNRWFTGETPPSTAVMQPQAASAPDEVRLAIMLSAAGVALGTLRDLVDTLGHYDPYAAGALGLIALFCIVAAAFLNSVAKGLRWARTAWAVTVGIRSFFVLLELRDGSCFVALLCLAELGLEIGGTVRLYREPAADWVH